MKISLMVLALVSVACFSADVKADGWFRGNRAPGRQVFLGGGHQGLVAASGIRPHQVGSHEGVGASTVSHADALRNACFYGKRQMISVQYSKQGNMFYAVARYN